MQELLESRHVILMANGTCATHCLFISLKYLHSEITTIYVPNNCYIAAINTLLYEYEMQNIELMKMDEDTWNVNTKEDYILSLKPNSAVLIVHNLGNIVNVPRLKTLRPDLVFLEDNCEGLFGKYQGTYSGVSDSTLCSSVSFYGNKIITTGEGGAFCTNNTLLYEHIKKVYSQGMSSRRYLHDVHAYNYRMTNVQAAFLYDQLTDLTTILAKKRTVFETYEKMLQRLICIGKVKLFEREHTTQPADWIFALRIVGNLKTVDETYAFFKSNGVDTRPFFYPLYSHKHLSALKNEDMIPEMLNKEVIMIPSSPSITVGEQQKVVGSIHLFVLYNQNIGVVSASESDVSDFLPKINSPHFRYFNSRSVDCIQHHVCTFLFKDLVSNEVFAYTHIDYDEESSRNWFGIYIVPTYRGKKYGEIIMDYTLQSFKDRCKTIYLSVDISNHSAIKLYEKYGFVVECENQEKKIQLMKYL